MEIEEFSQWCQNLVKVEKRSLAKMMKDYKLSTARTAVFYGPGKMNDKKAMRKFE